MIDYHFLILRAVTGLDPNTDETRRLVYERTRSALTSHLQTLDPPLSEADRMQQRLELEEAFRRVEAEVAKAAESGMPFHEFAHSIFVADALRKLAETLDQCPYGVRLALAHDGAFDFASTETPADRATTTVPFFEQRLAEIQRNADALDVLATPLAERPGWHGLAHAARLMSSLLNRPGGEIAGGVAPLWILSTCLAAYIERSEDARTGHFGVAEPLDPIVLQVLREFVFVAGPWVRRFPSGRILDDTAREHPCAVDEVEPAIEFFRRVRQAGLVRDDDARAIWIALDAGGGVSIPAAKVRSWAIGTARNIAVVMVKELAAGPQGEAGGEGADAATHADVVHRIERIVVESESEFRVLLSPLSADGGAALKNAFAMLNRTEPLPPHQ